MIEKGENDWGHIFICQMEIWIQTSHMGTLRIWGRWGKEK
jgi:hypothetical protein